MFGEELGWKVLGRFDEVVGYFGEVLRCFWVLKSFGDIRCFGDGPECFIKVWDD